MMELYKIIIATAIFVCSISMFITAYKNKTKHDKFSMIASMSCGILTFFSSAFIITNYRNDYVFYLILAATNIVIIISAIFEIKKYTRKKSL